MALGVDSGCCWLLVLMVIGVVGGSWYCVSAVVAVAVAVVPAVVVAAVVVVVGVAVSVALAVVQLFYSQFEQFVGAITLQLLLFFFLLLLSLLLLRCCCF